MLEIYDQSLQLLAVLENANNKELERKANNIWFFSFSLPINDPKNEHCQHFNFVEVVSKTGRKYGKFRILPAQTEKHKNSIRYSCEHVIGTLWDDVLDTDDTNGYVQFTNIDVRTVIETLLTFQTTQHWVLGQCDFDGYIESYGFENENNLFNPVFSIPEPLGVPYEFTYNTDVYPFQLNLVQASDEVKSEYRWGKDILEFNKLVDPSDIVNYLIPKGYGEGINALTINSVNGGKKYLKDDASIAKWGRKSDIRIDRRFKIPASLKRWGENLLSELKDPKFSIDVKAADLSLLPGHEHEKRLLNSVANVIVGDDVYKVRIIKETIKDLDREHLVDYELGNEIGTIAKTNADEKKRREVQERYSNGNTTLDSISVSDNCDENYPLVFRLWIPDDVVNVNTMDLTYETTKFRAFTRGSEAGGGTFKSTKGGGGGTSGPSSRQTSASGGGGTSGPSSRQTSASGGGGTSGPSSRQTSSEGGSHRHRVFRSVIGPVQNNSEALFYGRNSGGAEIDIAFNAVATDLYTYDASGSHSHDMDHTHTIPPHSHDMDHTHTLSPHSHDMDHTHTMQPHSHDFELEPHEHPQIYGVYEAPDTPTSLEISIDGVAIPEDDLSGENIDIIPYLPKDEGGRIQRNRWVTIEMSPDKKAKINASVVMRFFISSHIGGVY